ncbi:MAG: hypothetical protein JRN06_04690 [Nitrososphaerota archaeon]|nr:hypothetical protein [Nitrososphaerota archaeon]MDG7023915.1 hypothetical protein [Nitrososphaerota archaeon]
MALPFMGVSVAFMFLALTVGIFRLSAQNGVGPILLADLYPLHPLLMVFGFIAGVIMTERIAGVELLPHTKQTTLSLAMPPFILGGVAVETASYLLGLTSLRYLGAALLVISCLFFLALLRSFLRTGRERISVLFMILSACALLLSAVLSAFSLPAGNVGFAMTLLLFPVIFVLGERVELTSLATSRSPNRFTPAFFLAATAAILFGFGAWFPATGSLVCVVAFGVTGAAFAFFLVMEKSARPRSVVSPFQRYVSSHVGLAYIWGLAGSAFGVAYSLSPLFVFYDAFIHSLALGFIGLMLLAHGPIILPMVARRGFDNASLSFAPLAILVAATVLRIGAEFALLGSRAWLLNLSISASGWLVLLAVIAFFVEIVRGTAHVSAAGSATGALRPARCSAGSAPRHDVDSGERMISAARLEEWRAF